MVLRVEDVSKTYPAQGGAAARPILDGVSFEMAAGQTLALTGDSGSGKSTLLHIVGTLDQPDQGRVELAGQDLTGLGDAARAQVRRTQIGFVFQQFNLIPSLTVATNIAFQARLAGRAGRPEAVAAAPAVRDAPRSLAGAEQEAAEVR